MPFYEVLATVSLTLAIAIPAFLEKVMRTGYEKRVDSYRSGVIQEFREVFFEAFNNFNQAQSLTEDIEEKISDVVEMWEQVKTNYHRLEFLIKFRMYLFIGWMLVFCCCILALYSQDQGMQTIANIDWKVFSDIGFLLLMIVTIGYGASLFKFDLELSRYSEDKKGEKIEAKKEPIIFQSGINTARGYFDQQEKKIENYLIDNNIKFEKDVKISNKIVDYVLPNSITKKVIIEVKFSSSGNVYPLLLYERVITLFSIIKHDYPDVKTLLVTNIDLSKNKSKYEDIKKFTDMIIDIKELDKLGNFLKEETAN